MQYFSIFLFTIMLSFSAHSMYNEEDNKMTNLPLQKHFQKPSFVISYKQKDIFDDVLASQLSGKRPSDESFNEILEQAALEYFDDSEGSYKAHVSELPSKDHIKEKLEQKMQYFAKYRGIITDNFYDQNYQRLLKDFDAFYSEGNYNNISLLQRFLGGSKK